jgi:hypothetical protein
MKNTAQLLGKAVPVVGQRDKFGHYKKGHTSNIKTKIYKVCPSCKNKFISYSTYCSKSCYWKSKIGKKNWWGYKISKALKGVPKSKEHVEKVRLAITGKKRPDMTGKNHRFWKGDKAMYGTLHDWVAHHLGRPKLCKHCKSTDSLKRYQWANVSGKYLRDLSDWIRLCVQCHRKMDKNIRRAGLLYNKHEDKKYYERK